jgi:hypothetical protein
MNFDLFDSIFQLGVVFFRRKNLEMPSVNKRSSSQKNLNLSPTQRLDNLIQASNNDLTSEGMREFFFLDRIDY